MEVTRSPCPDTDQDTFVAVITDDDDDEEEEEEDHLGLGPARKFLELIK